MIDIVFELYKFLWYIRIWNFEDIYYDIATWSIQLANLHKNIYNKNYLKYGVQPN